MASNFKAKRLVLTAAVTSITIAGTLYGAGLKSGQEVTQAAQKAREVSIDERISALRNTREELAAKKGLVEKQMKDLEVRIEERKRKNIDGLKKEPPHN
ncbi:hypothetical protein P170DRAFT_475551 [Aspergillus steynii IBT 23096]|uniref:Uncharacterized protein n=1 Tax=Aspergillus steynii IBT 23096 TaxID=1392250 RepID=A0A2I2G8P7_9EURO|nr:uncharacterized protein P170DRAFT_475551 [Aspergillus steynii IBT 23096]PLB49250.1 hypothetical protein P170DRAFT_475551 [Aspergillus steynii IBT 23096]